jgi:mannitol/fructose-specific phosphotransferase system IIA component (Ntr-type)
LISLHDANPLLALAIVLIAGALVGHLAKRARLPGITGYILAGVLLGGHGLNLLGEHAAGNLQPLTDFALGLMAVTVGAHLNLRRLRNARKRLILLLVAESTVTPLLVFGGLIAFTDTAPPIAALFAALAISTAPATIIAIVKEARAKGVFVKTLVAAVALNNMSCIFLFEVARAVARVELDPSLEHDLAGLALAPTFQLLGALVLGGGIGLAVVLLVREGVTADRRGTVSAIAILLTTGVAGSFGLSPLLSCVFLGFAQTNFVPERDRLADRVFEGIETAILIVFFTLAGMHLSLEHFEAVLLVAGLFVGLRLLGKTTGAWAAMRLAGATDSVRRHLGPALTPQAGVAVGLVILIQQDAAFGEVQELFVAVVLSAVTFAEIVGPVLTRRALEHAGEAGRDRPRLMDFIHEQNILTGLKAETKEEAIAQLVDHLLRTRPRLAGVDRERLLGSVLAREAEASTCLGSGLAIPHGELSETREMAGAMGLSAEGLPFETPDGRPVHCMVLLATPEEERERHLQVLAALARVVGIDRRLQDRLYNAESPAHAYEIIHDERSEDFNYFLEDDGED